MESDWQDFLSAAARKSPALVPVALIVDSPWLPGYAGIDTRDYFLDTQQWLSINRGLQELFPKLVCIPGFWWEYGMAAEPSAFGARMHFHHNQPPTIEPLVKDIEFWADLKPANPQQDGLMPLVLRQYNKMEQILNQEGQNIRMVAARGPMTTASWIMGVSELMVSTVENPVAFEKVLKAVTTTIIDWLQAQLDCLKAPEGILLLDDLVGMVSKRQYERIYLSPFGPHF